MTVRGKIFVFVLLVLALAVITPAFAGERQKLGDAWWTGPLETPNPNALPKNSFYGETYFIVEQDNGSYDTKGKQFRQPYDNAIVSQTMFAYGITNRFNLQVLPVFYGVQAKDSGAGASTGLVADNLWIRLPIQLLKFKEKGTPLSLTFTPGFVAPTGHGEGNVWQPYFGVWAQRPFWMPGGRILRVRGAQSFFFPLQDQQFGSGSSAYIKDAGKYYKTQIGFEYSLTKHWVPAMDLYWKYGSLDTKKNTSGAIQSIGNCTTTTVVNGCDSFRRLVIDPALEYNFTGNVGIIFGVEMTVSGRNTGSYIAPQIALQWFKQ